MQVNISFSLRPRLLTCLSPWMNGSGVDSSALADGGVGGVLLLMPTVARKQVTQAGMAETIS